MIVEIEQHRRQIEDLCRKYEVASLDLIGSALRDDFNSANSDIDFVVQFSNFTVQNAADRYLGLMVDLEDLLGRRVDLVSYKAIKNPYFKQVVDQTRVNLYAA